MPPADPTPAALARALTHATDWLDALPTRPVGAHATLEELRAAFGRPFPETGTDPLHVIDDLVASAEPGLNASPGGRFYAWVIGGGLPAALAADWLTGAWDQNAGLYAVAPAAAVVEEVAGAWLLELFDLPRDASFAFVTGCQMAHATALAAARHAVLRRAGWDVEADGLAGAPPIRVLASAERHSSIDRALRLLGLGTRCIVPLPVDADGEVTADVMGPALEASSGPTIVVLDAADLNIAAFAPFEDLVPLAHAHGAWVHVDGAFGLFARASAAHRGRTRGLDLADSWATDMHKWLNVPYDSGLAVVRDRAAHRAAMTVSAAYLTAEPRARDQIDWNPEFSRRARGFAVYAALRELGREGVAAMVDRCCAHGRAIVTGIGALDGAEALWVPHLNQGLVRFRDPASGADEAAHDRRTDAVIAAINAGGEAFVSGTSWRGRRAMRVSVVNWRTGEDDVRRAVAAARDAIAALR